MAKKALGKKIKSSADYSHASSTVLSAAQEGSHEIEKTRKLSDLKRKIRYLKSYKEHEKDVHTANLEAAASDLYAFLLGTTRSARGRSLSDGRLVSTALPADFLSTEEHLEQLFQKTFPMQRSISYYDDKALDNQQFVDMVINDWVKFEMGSVLAASYLLNETDLHLGNVGFANGSYLRFDYDRSLEPIKLRELLFSLNDPALLAEKRRSISRFIMERFELPYVLEYQKLEKASNVSLDAYLKEKAAAYDKWRDVLSQEQCIEVIASYLKYIETVSDEDLLCLSIPKQYSPLNNWLFLGGNFDGLKPYLKRIAQILNVALDDDLLDRIAESCLRDSRSTLLAKRLSEIEQSIKPSSLTSAVAASSTNQLASITDLASIFQFDKMKIFLKSFLLTKQQIVNRFEPHFSDESFCERSAESLLKRILLVKNTLFKSPALKTFLRKHFRELMEAVHSEINQYNASLYAKIQAEKTMIDRASKPEDYEAVNEAIKAHFSSIVRLDFQEFERDLQRLLILSDKPLPAVHAEYQPLLEKTYALPIDMRSIEPYLVKPVPSVNVSLASVINNTPSVSSSATLTRRPPPVPKQAPQYRSVVPMARYPGEPVQVEPAPSVAANQPPMPSDAVSGVQAKDKHVSFEVELKQDVLQSNAPETKRDQLVLPEVQEASQSRDSSDISVRPADLEFERVVSEDLKPGTGPQVLPSTIEIVPDQEAEAQIQKIRIQSIALSSSLTAAKLEAKEKCDKKKSLLPTRANLEVKDEIELKNFTSAVSTIKSMTETASVFQNHLDLLFERPGAAASSTRQRDELAHQSYQLIQHTIAAFKKSLPSAMVSRTAFTVLLTDIQVVRTLSLKMEESLKALQARDLNRQLAGKAVLSSSQRDAIQHAVVQLTPFRNELETCLLSLNRAQAEWSRKPK